MKVSLSLIAFSSCIRLGAQINSPFSAAAEFHLFRKKKKISITNPKNSGKNKVHGKRFDERILPLKFGVNETASTKIDNKISSASSLSVASM